jgi:NhaP-type Na+/H+ and K+/H+ antiporter
MPKHIAQIVMDLNPFYLCSDLLRKAMVHKVELYKISAELATLGLICIFLAGFVWVSHKLMKRHVIMRFSGYIARRDVKRMIHHADI